MVLHSIENKNAIFFPSRTVKTHDVEEFILENIALVLLLVGCRERPSFHNVMLMMPVILVIVKKL